MIVTIDTNVMFQALYSRLGASFYVLQLIRNQEIGLALSVAVFNEYQDVLQRETSLSAFGLNHSDVDAFLRFVAFVARPHDIYFRWRPNLRDESDNMLFELAVASRSKWLITSNVRDFTVDKELRSEGITIGTPAQFVQQWKTDNE